MVYYHLGVFFRFCDSLYLFRSPSDGELQNFEEQEQVVCCQNAPGRGVQHDFVGDLLHALFRYRVGCR